MQTRPGVSLVEVLVATVLLAIGVASTLQALTAASRLRQAASAREQLAMASLDRLAWFESQACLLGDTTGVDSSASVSVRWQVTDSAAVRALRVRAGSVAPRATRLHFEASWPCA